MQRVRKKILFVNPAKRDSFPVGRIHMGLTILGGILVEKGHEVRVVDYAFLNSGYAKIPVPVPSLPDLIRDFNPDIVGISVFSYLYNEVQSMVQVVADTTDAILLLGGPHFAVFPDDFSDSPHVDYIIAGEAETTILGLVEGAAKHTPPLFVSASRPAADDIAPINLDIAYGHSFLPDYQIQLSRGCPFGCSFCNIHMVGGRQVRKRSIESCVREIVNAKSRHPSIVNISITDDCPTVDKARFNRFLDLFTDADTGCTLSVDNMRADLLDEELLGRFVKARGQNICLGVESGNDEVFRSVNKGETFDDIIKAAALVRRSGLVLGNCFIIGLPGDNPERHKESMALAHELKPDYLFWNMCTPWPSTPIRKWFDEHGQVGDVRNFSTLIDPFMNFSDPPCWTEDFTREQRIVAWLKANLETHDWFKPCDLAKVERLCNQYHLQSSLAVYLQRRYRVA